MIQPTENLTNELGHPMWKRNAFAGFAMCVIGIALMISVALFLYGAVVLVVGFAWAVVACLIGVMQERREARGPHVPQV